MAYQVLRIEKRKGGAIRAIAQHIDRSKPPKYADPNKQQLNRELLGDNAAVLSYTQINDKIDALLSHVKRKIRPDQVRCAEFLLSASPEYFRPPNSGLQAGEWDEQRLNQWIKLSTQFLDQEIGPRAISATLHLDETTPHIHALVVPIGNLEKWNLSFDEFAGNRQKLRQWQDTYQQYMGQLGLLRGERSLANNVQVRDYHNRVANQLDFERQLEQRDKQLYELKQQLERRDRALKRLEQQLWARDIVSVIQDLQRKYPNQSTQQLLPNGYHVSTNDDGFAALSNQQRLILKRNPSGAINPGNISQDDLHTFQQHAHNLKLSDLGIQIPAWCHQDTISLSLFVLCSVE